MGKAIGDRREVQLDFKYVCIPYSLIPNEKVDVSEQEIETYLKKNAKQYAGPVTASIEFVRFKNELSSSDLKTVHDELTAVMDEWKKTDNDALFLSKE